jgi:hypothetical protein
LISEIGSWLSGYRAPPRGAEKIAAVPAVVAAADRAVVVEHVVAVDEHAVAQVDGARDPRARAAAGGSGRGRRAHRDGERRD